jgi:hypothetical protein
MPLSLLTLRLPSHLRIPVVGRKSENAIAQNPSPENYATNVRSATLLTQVELLESGDAHWIS